MTKVIGLTGGIASGKSTISNIFKEVGWPVIDADQTARQVVMPGSLGLAQIVSRLAARCFSLMARLIVQRWAAWSLMIPKPQRSGSNRASLDYGCD